VRSPESIRASTRQSIQAGAPVKIGEPLTPVEVASPRSLSTSRPLEIPKRHTQSKKAPYGNRRSRRASTGPLAKDERRGLVSYEKADEPGCGDRQSRRGQVNSAATRHLPNCDQHQKEGKVRSHTKSLAHKLAPRPRPKPLPERVRPKIYLDKCKGYPLDSTDPQI
jgi:hypothetical protein